MPSTFSTLLAPSALILAALAGPAVDAPEVPRVEPEAVAASDPVPSAGDAADDPAIWVHPVDPSRSLVLATDKKGGLNVFGLDGHRRAVVSDGSEPNNVDVLTGFDLGGKPVDLVVAGTRGKGHLGVTAWRVDPEGPSVVAVGPSPSFLVFGGGEPYGSCTYRSPRDGRCYVFVSNKDGAIEQHQIVGRPDGTIEARMVRRIEVGSQVEGLVADPDLGHLYAAEEDVAIWKYSAEPEGGSVRSKVAGVGEPGIVADIEGLTIYRGVDGQGYLIASIQGAHTFEVFERGGSNRRVATIDPKANALGDLGETDGLDACARPLGPQFPRGLLVAQDGRARDGRQNFKFFRWEDVAGEVLKAGPAK